MQRYFVKAMRHESTVIWATNQVGDNQLGDRLRSVGGHESDQLGHSVYLQCGLIDNRLHCTSFKFVPEKQEMIYDG